MTHVLTRWPCHNNLRTFSTSRNFERPRMREGTALNASSVLKQRVTLHRHTT